MRIRIPFPSTPTLIQPLNLHRVWIGKYLEAGTAPFGFPDTNTGPDIIFSLEILDSNNIVESRILVLVQVFVFPHFIVNSLSAN